MKAEKIVTVQTNAGPMQVHVVLPENTGAKKHPALIVLQEAFGVNSHILHVCQRLAKQGYVALAPELFHRSGQGLTVDYTEFAKVRPLLGSLTNDDIAEDIRATWELAQTLPEVDGGKIGTIGYCMGGFAAVLGACRLPLQAAMSFYGGGMAHERPGFGFHPYLEEFSKIKAPVFLGFGEADATIPLGDIEIIKKRLAAEGKKAEILVYPGANHGFMCDERAAYHPEMSEKAWKDTFNWLKACGTMSL